MNATSVPDLSLSMMEGNAYRAYSRFPQGEWTANEAIQTPEVQYLVQSTNRSVITKQTIRFKPRSSQFLLLTGDLSYKGPADRLPQIVSPPPPCDLKLGRPTFSSISSLTLSSARIPATIGSSTPCRAKPFFCAACP